MRKGQKKGFEIGQHSTHELFTETPNGSKMSLLHITAFDKAASLRIALNYRNLFFAPQEKSIIKIKQCDE